MVLSLFFFFFKQKTAYEMLRSLVGSEMCIRDRFNTAPERSLDQRMEALSRANEVRSRRAALKTQLLSLIHI